MKKFLLAIGLITAIVFLNSCQWQNTFTMTITHFSLNNESVRLVQGIPSEQPISIAVHYEVTDENNEVRSVTLAEGQLVDGKLALDQKVIEPTRVVISVKVGADGENAWTTAVLRPNNTIDFVLVHTVTPNAIYYTVQLKGNDHRSIDLNSRFLINGDLSQLHEFVSELVHVSLRATSSVLDGSGITLDFGQILVDQGEFSIEGDLDGPTLVTIEIAEHTTFMGSRKYLHAILEPGVSYSIVPLGENGEYAVLADRESLHSKLITSWQFDPEFVALVDTLVAHRMKLQVGWERLERAEYQKESIKNYPVAEACDHVTLTDRVKSRFIAPYQYAFSSTANQIVEKRSTSLRQMMRDTEDVELARMIFELIWVLLGEDDIFSDRDRYERIAALLELAEKVHQDFVDQIVAPRVESLRKQEKLKERDSSLLPGHVAPEFALTTIAGDEVSLNEVLKDNELVLVDFWASWCDPCIESFPALKKMYSTFKTRGFEIVTISIDDSFEDWESAADEQDLPWIDLGVTEEGEMKSATAPTSDDYGVRWIPNKFLIDKDGCIVDKQFSDGQLKTMLSSRLADLSVLD